MRTSGQGNGTFFSYHADKQWVILSTVPIRDEVEGWLIRNGGQIIQELNHSIHSFFRTRFCVPDVDEEN